MKKAVKTYLSFTRAERAGLMVLCIVLVLLVGIRATMYLWVHPENDTPKNEIPKYIWQTASDTEHITKKDYQDAYDENTTAMPDSIDLNTADSATLVRLKGIGPATANKIVAYRNRHLFKNVSELQNIRHIPDATYEQIKKHIYVSHPRR